MSQTIFVSYARYDNARPPGEPSAQGFVSRLIEELKYEFSKMARPWPDIWMDVDKIRDGELFDHKIQSAISESSLFVPVLSTNWLESGFCRQELECFRQRWSPVDDAFKERITVVHGNFVALKERPAELDGQVGYRFFDFPNGVEEPNGERFFFDRGKSVHEAHYLSSVRELARDLWVKTRPGARPAPAPVRGIRLMVAQPLEPVPPEPVTPPRVATPATRNGRTIYLAKPSLDLEPAYQRVAGELLAQGYDIRPQPDAYIPSDCSAAGFIDDALASCELSVHLLGNDVGFAIAGGATSVGLQLRRAAAAVQATSGSKAEFRRIVWAPKILQASADADGARKTGQRDPLQVLQLIDDYLPNDKVDGGGVNDFVTFLIQHLDSTAPKVEQVPPPPNGSTSKALSYYIYHNSIDFLFAQDVAEAMRHRPGVETKMPGMSGDVVERDALHRRYMRECDAILLCWGGASDTWAKSYAAELKDWRTLGRNEQFKVRGVVVGPPDDLVKKYVDRLWPNSEIDVVIPVNSLDGFSPETFRG